MLGSQTAKKGEGKPRALKKVKKTGDKSTTQYPSDTNGPGWQQVTAAIIKFKRPRDKRKKREVDRKERIR